MFSSSRASSAYSKAVKSAKTEAEKEEIGAKFDVQEQEYRAKFAQDRESKELKDPYLHLTPVYNSNNGVLDPIFVSPPPGKAVKTSHPTMFTLDAKSQLPPNTPSVTESEKEFKRNWDVFTEGSLREIDWSNVFAAGGSVLAALLPLTKEQAKNNQSRRTFYHEQAYLNSDIDLFIYGLDEEAANAKLVSLFEQIQDALHYKCIAFRSKHAISVVSQYPVRNIQIVLRRYLSPAEILMGFDVDCCAVGYDGTSVWALPRTHRAFRSRTNTVDLTRRSPSYEMRLAKYASRGFQVAVAGLDRTKIDPQLFERPFEKNVGLARLLLLEKLRTPEERTAFKTTQRLKKLRPDLERAGTFWGRLNRRYQHDRYLTERLEEAGADASDYSVVFIPYGPSWTAEKVYAVMYSKDTILNSTWFDPGKTVHTHPAFMGTMEEVLKDCCGNCPPAPATPEVGTASKTQIDPVTGMEESPYVSGPISWIDIDPGRQSIGSFHPITEGDWAEGAYLSDAAGSLAIAIAQNDMATIYSLFPDAPPSPSPPSNPASNPASPAPPRPPRAVLGASAPLKPPSPVGAPASTANVESKDAVGRTPLLLATLCNNVELVRFFLERGARLTARLSDGRTALHVAASYGYLEVAKLLFEYGERLIVANQPAKDAAKAAENAVEASPQDRRLREAFKEAQAVVGELDDFQVDSEDWDLAMTPLGYAVFFGHIDMIRFLIQTCGAKISRHIVPGGTGKKSRNRTFRMVNVQTGVSYPLLHLAMLNRSPSQITVGKVLVNELGYDVNTMDLGYNTAFFHAASNRLHAWTDFLLSCPSLDLNRVVRGTPLTNAIQARDEGLLHRLLDAGAKVWYTTEELEKDPTRIANNRAQAAYNRKYGGFRRRAGAKPEPHIYSFSQPIHLAILSGKSSWVKLILGKMKEAGLDVAHCLNLPVSYGTTLDQITHALYNTRLLREATTNAYNEDQKKWARAVTAKRQAMFPQGSYAAHVVAEQARLLEDQIESNAGFFYGFNNGGRNGVDDKSLSIPGLSAMNPYSYMDGWNSTRKTPYQHNNSFQVWHPQTPNDFRQQEDDEEALRPFASGLGGPGCMQHSVMPDDEAPDDWDSMSSSQQAAALTALNKKLAEKFRKKLLNIKTLLEDAGAVSFLDIDLDKYKDVSDQTKNTQLSSRQQRDRHLSGLKTNKKQQKAAAKQAKAVVTKLTGSDPLSWVYYGEIPVYPEPDPSDPYGGRMSQSLSQWLNFNHGNIGKPYEEACRATMKLFEAVFKGDLAAVKNLTSTSTKVFPHGVFVAVVDEVGNTPLSLAVSLGHSEIAGELIRAAARQFTPIPKPEKKTPTTDLGTKMNNWDLVAGTQMMRGLGNKMLIGMTSMGMDSDEEAEPVDPNDPLALEKKDGEPGDDDGKGDDPSVACHVPMTDFIQHSGCVIHMAVSHEKAPNMLKVLIDALSAVKPQADPLPSLEDIHPSLRATTPTLHRLPVATILGGWNSQGMTAFEWAVSHGNLRAAELLLSFGGGIDPLQALAGTTLAKARVERSEPTAGYAGLSMKGRKAHRYSMVSPGLQSKTVDALQIAIFYGRIELVKWLMDGRADAILSKYFAAYSGVYPESVSKLFPTVFTWFRPMSNESGVKPVTAAFYRVKSHIRPEHVRAFKMYLELERKRIEAEQKSNRALKWLPRSMVDVVSPYGGRQPLVMAVVQGHVEMTMVLLEAGAKVNGVDPTYGWTALHYAAWLGRANLVSVLLKAGARTDIEGHSGSAITTGKPYMVAVGSGYGDVARDLRTGHSLDAPGQDGNGVGHVAAEQGWLGCLQLLSSPSLFLPALPGSAKGSTIDATRMAVTGGKEVAWLNAENAVGMTPVDVACVAWARFAFQHGHAQRPHEDEVAMKPPARGVTLTTAKSKLRGRKGAGYWYGGRNLGQGGSSDGVLSVDADEWDRYATTIDIDAPGAPYSSSRKGGGGWQQGTARPELDDHDPRGTRSVRQTALALFQAAKTVPRTFVDPKTVRASVATEAEKEKSFEGQLGKILGKYASGRFPAKKLADDVQALLAHQDPPEDLNPEMAEKMDELIALAEEPHSGEEISDYDDDDDDDYGDDAAMYAYGYGGQAGSAFAVAHHIANMMGTGKFPDLSKVEWIKEVQLAVPALVKETSSKARSSRGSKSRSRSRSRSRSGKK